MYDPEEPPLLYTPPTLHQANDRKPLQTYEGPAAHVRLLSWGTDRNPAYSLNVVRIIDGRLTCGRTFTAASFPDLKIEAMNHGGRDQAVMADIEQCLALAGQRIEIPNENEASS